MPKILENTRENLLSEGRKLLVENNFSTLNIRKIAKNCSIGLGTFYNYFDNKEQFVAAIVSNDWQRIIEIIQKLTNEHIPLKEKLNMIYEEIDNFLKTYRGIFNEIMNFSRESKRKYCSFEDVFTNLELLLEKEDSLGNIKSNLSHKKLSLLIINNMFSLSKYKYMTFEELYDSLNI